MKVRLRQSSRQCHAHSNWYSGRGILEEFCLRATPDIQFMIPEFVVDSHALRIRRSQGPLLVTTMRLTASKLQTRAQYRTLSETVWEPEDLPGNKRVLHFHLLLNESSS
jgi:hypothetical protein